MSIGEDIAGCLSETGDRLGFWSALSNRNRVETACEIGVFRGEFAAHFLKNVPSIKKYFMLDPWRNLDKWEKPANREDDEFQQIYLRAMKVTDDYSDVRVVLRGKTTEMIDEIEDGSLDFAYVDGDHTLRGVAIDLIKVFPKLKPGALLAGDDFVDSIFQHGEKFEPTLVFPFAVYFAEAVGCPMWGLPRNQFLIVKDGLAGFSFTDLAGKYENTGLKTQIYGAARRGRRMAAGVNDEARKARRARRAAAGKPDRGKNDGSREDAPEKRGAAGPETKKAAGWRKNLKGRIARRLARAAGPGTGQEK